MMTLCVFLLKLLIGYVHFPTLKWSPRKTNLFPPMVQLALIGSMLDVSCGAYLATKVL